MLKRIALGLLALAILAVIAGAGGYGWYRTYEPDRDRYPVRGIDVSNHQGRIDWPAVARDDVAFAYVKATEGGDFRDRRFLENWRGARAAGLPVGAYHFFTLCRPGKDQAANFLAVVPKDPSALPPVVDIEFGGNCGARPQGPAFRRELDDFLTPVEAATGRPALLYVTPEFLEAYGAVLPERPLWRRSIVREPAGPEPWVIWQHHNRGRVDGVEGPVDLNVFSGDRHSFAAWAAGS